MVLTLILPARKFYGLQNLITERHLANMTRVMLTTGLIVAYGYVMELFMSWYSGNQFEQFMTLNRMFGPYAKVFWLVMICNVVIPQILWFEKIRRNLIVLFLVAIIINVGMWAERYMIVITSLHRDFMPSAWGMFHGTRWDWATFIGTIGLFLSLMFLFVRFLPMMSMTEVRELVHENKSNKAKK